VKKIFLDTNIFLRFFLNDNQVMYEDCVTLFQYIFAGKIQAYTSCIVYLEIIYTLTRLYHFSLDEVLTTIEKIGTIRNLVVIDKANTKNALNLYRLYHIKFGDCLIATQVSKGVILCTYDKDFGKIKGLTCATPGKIIA
jgi:predicted nucleic-acid-binding protein